MRAAFLSERFRRGGSRMRNARWKTKTLLHGFEILLALLVWMNPGCLEAETSDRAIGQFVHTSWSAKDGAPGDVYALAQTTDGFLWLGTSHGLYRFDGITFERYEPESGPAFVSSAISALLALPNGDLWIGFDGGGVSRLRGGRNTNYTKPDGLPWGTVVRLVQDREGVIWAGTYWGLARFEDGRWRRIGVDWSYPGARAAAVYVDRHGTLWVATENTVVFLPPGSRKFQTTGTEVGQTYQIVESRGGTLWMAETTRSVHPLILPANRPSVEPEIRVGSAGILFDNDGSLWITSLGDGMRRVPFPDRLNGRKIGEFSSAIESFTSKDGLTSDLVTCVLKDREGTIWVGTSAGLDRFRRGALVPILLPAKFTHTTLVAGDAGDIWVSGMSNALARIEGNTRKDVRPGLSAMSGLRDSHGTIWFLDEYGPAPRSSLVRLNKERPTVVAVTPSGFDFPEFRAVLGEDRMGKFWLGGGKDALFFLTENRQWHQFEMPPELAGKSAVVAFTDASGSLWLGLTENSIIVIDGERVRTFLAKDGIQVDFVDAITGRDGNIWIGGDSGLEVWQGNRFRVVLPADGDAFHEVSGIEVDSGGDLFLSEERGVVFIPATEVAKILEDPSTRVQYRLFDVHDGLPGAVQTSPPYPTAVQGTDGRIWFSTSAGVAWINPAHIPRNPLPPPVVIRSITANGVRYTSPAALKLPPRTRDLTIDYTALSLAIPERVRFRYKLEGSDTQWQDAGARRQAFYTNLPPGQYLFRVIASNNDGVWNEAGAHLDFNIAPAWYQTTWFHSFCVAAFALFLWALYQLRLRQLARQFNMRLEERVGERTRIARELHDTLLQSLHGLLMSFQRAANLLPERPGEAKQRLEDAIDQATQAIIESRDAVQGLRSSAVLTNDLALAIQAFGDQLAAKEGEQNSTVFDVAVEGTQCDLNPILRDDVYRIVGEALRNAFQHAQAQRIEVEIRYDQRQLRVRIRDDGKGVDAQVLSSKGQPGHWGLPGMQERAKLVGGQLEIWSQLDSGTEIELIIPASVAYYTSAQRQS